MQQYIIILIFFFHQTHETPLHYCARAGNEDILLEIVKHIGPNKVQVAVNKQAKNGWSPLLVASEQGHLNIVKILLQNHARVDVFDEVTKMETKNSSFYIVLLR